MAAGVATPSSQACAGHTWPPREHPGPWTAPPARCGLPRGHGALYLLKASVCLLPITERLMPAREGEGSTLAACGCRATSRMVGALLSALLARLCAGPGRCSALPGEPPRGSAPREKAAGTSRGGDKASLAGRKGRAGFDEGALAAPPGPGHCAAPPIWTSCLQPQPPRLAGVRVVGAPSPGLMSSLEQFPAAAFLLGVTPGPAFVRGAGCCKLACPQDGHAEETPREPQLS